MLFRGFNAGAGTITAFQLILKAGPLAGIETQHAQTQSVITSMSSNGVVDVTAVMEQAITVQCSLAPWREVSTDGLQKIIARSIQMKGPQLSDLSLTSVVERRFGLDGRIFDEQRTYLSSSGLRFYAYHLGHDALVSSRFSTLLKMGLNASTYVDAFSNVEQRIVG